MACGFPSLAALAGITTRRAYVQRSRKLLEALDVIELRVGFKAQRRRIPRKSREDCPVRTAAVKATLMRLRRSAA